ncbi:spermidine synthase [Halobacteriales archaeon Cl-PHB]
MTETRGGITDTLPISGVAVAVFVSGVASMGLEIVAGRLLAPTFGSSVYVWGSVIGVFLAALTAGYWLAGRRAGSHASRGGLALALVGAAAFVAGVIVFGNSLIAATGDLPIPARFAPVVPVTLLFGPLTLLLGFVSPYGAELVSAKGRGDASGRVYALGTAGSIVGAFGTTFFLIPAFQLSHIEFAYGILLVLAAMLVAPRSDPLPTTASIAVAFALVLSLTVAGAVPSVGGNTVYQTQTAYQELSVVDQGTERTLWLDGARHSAMDLTDRDRYVFEYTRYFHLPLLLQDDVDRVLFVGGGGFSGPKRFLQEYPNVTVDVVEIDPEVVRVAREYFDVPRTDRLNVHVGDGRTYLRETDETYDLIVLDAYRSDRVPQHLTTVEFMDLAKSRLDEDGAVLANVISARDGPDSVFYRAQYRTMDRVFPQVYSFPTSESESLQNIELLATKDQELYSQAEFETRNRQRAIGLDLSEAISHYRANVTVGDAPLLRDGDAPVDALLARQVDTDYVVERTDDSEPTPTATATP